jgi:hypothetical protein
MNLVTQPEYFRLLELVAVVVAVVVEPLQLVLVREHWLNELMD